MRNLRKAEGDPSRGSVRSNATEPNRVPTTAEKLDNDDNCTATFRNAPLNKHQEDSLLPPTSNSQDMNIAILLVLVVRQPPF